VNAIVAPDALLGVAMVAAQKLAAKPAASLRETKELMKKGIRESIRGAMTEENEVFRQRLHSPEAREAFTAFIDKRSPDFSKFH
jgi:enoyl-CoA hydratase/carnithine racemase